MAVIPPPPEPPRPSLAVLEELEAKAYDAIDIVFDVLERFFPTYPGVEGEDVHDFFESGGGLELLESRLGLPLLGQGIDRYVFDWHPYVLKLEVLGSGANRLEWDKYRDIPLDKRRWVARPFYLSNDDMVLISEKLNAFSERSDPGFRRLTSEVSKVLRQEPWLDQVASDPSWYNWGYRGGIKTPVLLDYGE